jgi:hypothetical protein
MKKAFRILSLILVVVCSLVVPVVTVSCDDVVGGKDVAEQDESGLDFCNVGGETSGYGVRALSDFSLSEVEIPSMHDGRTVTIIMPSAFMYKSTLKSITIPDSITVINNMAFVECTGLESITIPDGVTAVEQLTFANCTSLKSVTLPAGITTLGEGAFDGCTALTSIHYAGTMAEWEAISKGSRWNSNTGEYTVYCADGELPKQP